MPRVAAIQMCSTGDKAANLDRAAALLADAAEKHAQLVVLPEMFNCLGPGSVLKAGAEPIGGPTSQWAREHAARHKFWLVAGSIVESVGSTERTSNTSLLVSPSGEIVATYRKIHLFDCDVPGAEFHESQVVTPGDTIVSVPAAGVGTVGLSICYDLRFPELYRILALQGADVIVVPAAFTAKTGPAHWEVLLRARAIENQAYVVAAGQYGQSAPGLAWHGHSMIIDPWGVVVAEVGSDGDAVVVADIDPEYVRKTRKILPSLANRRPETYRFPNAASATSSSLKGATTQ
ncbi:MAG: carbon-nitrogen hydrolase family protein [Acidimicrobiales bacterium]|nr:carbon-nitrogen hydrolase family protein [Acidimicrobiales bacterium]